MAREIPQKLILFLKNGLNDVDDGYEYASELNRIINSDDCQRVLSSKEIDMLKDYTDTVKKQGEITYYTQERIKEIERDIFGSKGILGYLGVIAEQKPQWPF